MSRWPLASTHDWDAGAALLAAAGRCATAQPRQPRVAIAGDGAGIGGWQAAIAAGRLAAAGCRAPGRPARPRRASPAAPARCSPQRRSALALRPFLDALYAPPDWILAPPDDATLVCRCEEVTAGQVRAAARLGATGPNQLKAYLRAGMGPCQGRLCGATLAALIAEARGTTPEAVGSLRPRAPYKPTDGRRTRRDAAACNAR